MSNHIGTSSKPVVRDVSSVNLSDRVNLIKFHQGYFTQ